MRQVLLAFLFCALSCMTFGQSTNASITGRITDPAKAVVAGAKIVAINTATNVQYQATTDSTGNYTFAALPPGTYRLEAEKLGFKAIVKNDVLLHVQDVVALNFEMSVGSASESITVEAGTPVVNTQDASVSTVVDRNFAENLPMNGRSFQTLIQLTPGVVLTPSSTSDGGQFSVNGQRASANYWMVDGVGANIGVSPFASNGNGFSGTLGSFSALGGTNSLVSVDAMQEFRIQTSSFAPEFGRTPGGQISIATRSGTNQFHGTVFDYLRNDAFDANNWFNGFIHNPALSKPKERQNDFGGTFSGPIVRNKTFFFLSYEGLRLALPQTTLTTVPDLGARQSAIPAVQPFLNAFPVPNGADDSSTGVAQFNSSYSDPASLDTYSLRLDHKVSDKLGLFGRYSYSPSDSNRRGLGGTSPLSVILASSITTQTATVGATWLPFSSAIDELRFNYSRVSGHSSALSDNFGGAVPLASVPFPSPFNLQNSNFQFQIFSLQGSEFAIGRSAANIQRQINLVDNLSLQMGAHNLKFGVDLRRLTPRSTPFSYAQNDLFSTVASAEAGSLLASSLESSNSVTIVIHNLGVFAQDTWRMTPHLTVTYGLRWDVDFAPTAVNGPSLPAVSGFNLTDLSHLALDGSGIPPYHTTYGNIAPRIGTAYRLSESHNWGSVLRGGFGTFFDLASSEIGNVITISSYPYSTQALTLGGTFPLSPTSAAPPIITPSNLSSGTLGAIDPNLRLPYTLEWNGAIEQSLGQQQSLTVTYAGAAGRRLLQSAFVESLNPGIFSANLVTNTATSDYDALQMEFRRRLSNGVQALASYTWSHSIDTASAGSAFGNSANGAVPALKANSSRGSSDFDIRHSFSAGITSDIPALKITSFGTAVLSGWSLENVIQARSAPPVNVADVFVSTLFNSFTQVRPDVVPGQSFYLFGPQFPGGKAFNPAAFVAPPIVNGQPVRQGTLGRNALRGFGAFQWDAAIHRDFRIHEGAQLQFRAEAFNVLNHPSFGQPSGAFPITGVFGISSQTLAQSLAGNNAGGGAFNPLYQIGGPRSLQLALKVMF